jgi:hypothetical protein
MVRLSRTTVGDNEPRAITILPNYEHQNSIRKGNPQMRIVRSILKAMYKANSQRQILLFKKNNYQSKHIYLRKHTIIRSLLRSRTMW